MSEPNRGGFRVQHGNLVGKGHGDFVEFVDVKLESGGSKKKNPLVG